MTNSKVRPCASELAPAEPTGDPDRISPRLLMRHYRSSDAEVIGQAIQESHASLARWVPDIARRHTPADVRSGLELLAAEHRRGRRLVYGLWERTSGDFLGEVGLYELQWERRSAEVGYWLRQSARGRGYAAEGLELAAGLAAGGLGLEQLEAHIAADNTASRQVAERQQFRISGERPAIPYWDGDATRMLIYTRALVSDVA